MEGPVRDGDGALVGALMSTIAKTEPRKAPHVERHSIDVPIERFDPSQGMTPSQAARKKFGNQYAYIGHDAPGSRAARRRLNQRGVEPEIRCDACKRWAKLSDSVMWGARRVCGACAQGGE